MCDTVVPIKNYEHSNYVYLLSKKMFEGYSREYSVKKWAQMYANPLKIKNLIETTLWLKRKKKIFQRA